MEDEFINVVYHIIAMWCSFYYSSIILTLRSALFLSTQLQKTFSFSISIIYCLDEILICSPFLLEDETEERKWYIQSWVQNLCLNWARNFLEFVVPESPVTCINNTAVGFQILSLPVHSLPACQLKEYGGPTGQLWGHSNEFFGVSCDKIASNQSNTEKTV